MGSKIVVMRHAHLDFTLKWRLLFSKVTSNKSSDFFLVLLETFGHKPCRGRCLCAQSGNELRIVQRQQQQQHDPICSHLLWLWLLMWCFHLSLVVSYCVDHKVKLKTEPTFKEKVVSFLPEASCLVHLVQVTPQILLHI